MDSIDGAVCVRLLEPFEGLVVLAQADMDLGDELGLHILLLRKLGQLDEERPCFTSPPGHSIRVSKLRRPGRAVAEESPKMINTSRVPPHHPAVFGVIVEYVENYGLGSARSTHGSAYRYDREVPLLLFGAGIEAGVSEHPARTVDVAPTLAHLAGVAFPATVDGDVLRVR